ncbi:MAG: M23 family metallopeptidase [Chitinophagaceae bacterium]|nr:M23 family metallopeptidase [Chitinophagaceae bacterium]
MRYFFLLVLITGFNSFAQQPAPPVYPKNYFRNPLGIAPSLAGNFGELRPNHYHMGLDFKTNRAENLPVYAAADGYIARVKIEPFGFGRAIYINHPNGYTTLYAHLNAFYPALEEYIKQEQYKRESWSVSLEIPPGMFTVKKGDFIANSGNSGGSQGPHLHFEIRNTSTEVNLNPMLFGLPIPDKVPPAIQRLAIYDRNQGIYEQTPKIIAVKKTAAGYTTVPAVITVNSNKVSFAVTSYDTHSGSSNLNGIYQGILYEDGKEVIRFTMDNIGYETTRYMNAHIDYKTKAGGGPYLQHLSQPAGYANSIYQPGTGNGVIELTGQTARNIKIETKDADGNTATLQFTLQYKPAPAGNKNLPGEMFYPGMLNVGQGSDDGDFYMTEKALYDSVRVNYVRAVSLHPAVVSAVHTIGNTGTPVQEGLIVRIRPRSGLTDDQLSRIVMQRFAGAKKQVVKPQWQQGWAMAKFRDFGSFQLVIDDTPPEIIPVGFKDSADLSKATRIMVTVKDNLDEFKNFRAELDGKWLRFTNDKGRNFIYIFDEQCAPGQHQLTLSVTDEAGNITTRMFTFSR